MHKNSLGQLCFVFAFFIISSLFFHIARNKSLKGHPYLLSYSLILLMSFWILGGSSTASSKTSVLTLLIGCGILCFYGVFQSDLKNAMLHLLSFFVLYFALNLFSELMLNQDFIATIASLAGRSDTLTGRVPLWTELLEIGPPNFLLGSGLGGFWTAEVSQYLKSLFIWRPTSAHNGYLDTYLNLGLIVLFLLIFLIVATIKNIESLHQVNLPFTVFRISMLYMIVIYNFAESTFAKGSSLLWFVFILISMNSGTMEKELKEHNVSI